jgi:hypothetical protein
MGWIEAPEGMVTENFSWTEAACRHCGKIPDEGTIRETANLLEQVRTLLDDRVIHVTSWCRCPDHNAALGGAPDSPHLEGRAVDINARGLAPHEVPILVRAQAPDNLRLSLQSAPGHTHIERR